ncbi:MAG: 5-histidylcysteine sulfoxide synthase [Cyanothece sp. SIO2G6]|nr:5-histidylcysteine sulfoxide synthase [Cyanothece sp. SIO2G6]
MITQTPDRTSSDRLLKSIIQLDKVSKNELLSCVEQAWQLEERLMRSLTSADTFYLNPDPLRNPLIFYLGHSAVFYINKLIRVGLLEQRINPHYEVLFEIGVDPSTPEELTTATQHIEWPDVEAVWQYRTKAREAIAQAIQQAPLDLPIQPQHPLWGLVMGIEHSRIHFETSSMLIRQLPLDRVQRPQDWPYAPTQTHNASRPNSMVMITGGTVNLGKPADSSTYGWDIDYGQRTVEVESFLVSQYPITNREFLAFIEAGGYENPEYWSPAAWDWRQRHEIQHPKFWRSLSSISLSANSPNSSASAEALPYRYRAMFDEIDLPLDWPVEVTHYEAMAFCRWKGEGDRLLTEAEWQRAVTVQEQRPLAQGDSSTDGYNNDYNLDFKWGSPCPVGSLAPQTATADIADIYDLRGNVWEWLGDVFAPLPGFQPHYLYEDYSMPFFDDQHYLMVGGSWASTGSYGSRSCRNWFRPYFPQHVGFRIAHDID